MPACFKTWKTEIKCSAVCIYSPLLLSSEEHRRRDRLGPFFHPGQASEADDIALAAPLHAAAAADDVAVPAAAPAFLGAATTAATTTILAISAVATVAAAAALVLAAVRFLGTVIYWW